MCPVVQMSGHHCTGGTADAFSRDSSLALPAVRLRHMFCLRGEAALLLRTWMLGNQCSTVIEANSLDIDMAANQRVEDGLRIFAVLHVIVRTDLCLEDINVFIPLWRQRLQCRFIQFFVQAFPATR